MPQLRPAERRGKSKSLRRLVAHILSVNGSGALDSPSMIITRKALTGFYILIAVAALVGTWGNNLQMLGGTFVEANVRFWQATLATPVSRSITVDIFWLGLPVNAWMLAEARRLKIRSVWLYLVGSFLIAISVTLPLFLIHRDRVLSRTDPNAGELSVADLVALAVLTLSAALYTAFALQ